ncbi:family 20 glycosylhydrolase [Streptomyces sp. TRM S81-3]|uniref:beta-N-acetylhexosaminidase n=1 Tax=Streptomyces griseicoloratus TaxID=2752516 RepID=A0A926L4N5_9ACTN|nr:family 20 glycosylhydrolase [Streptomyces griseicoloratus]MBD0421546.1 family 20 glycosylhydrolase [Streptomyces griseicoloratus]
MTVPQRLLVTVAALALCATTLTTLGGSPASADGDDPLMTDPGFESGTFDGGQYYHASLVAPGASGSGHAARVGLDYDGDSRYPRGGNLPVRGTGVSRGMVNKPVRQVEPNTVYEFTAKVRTEGNASVRVGVFDAENVAFYRGAANHVDVSSPTWTTVTRTITTGPRTRELNAFCFLNELGSSSGPGYCDDFAVHKVGPAADPAPAPPDDTRAWGANGFPVTIPAVQSFTRHDGESWQPQGDLSISVRHGQAATLRDDAERIAEEFVEAKLVRTATVRTVDDHARVARGILLTTGAVDLSAAPAKAQALASQAYRLDIDENAVRVTGGSDTGAFYGAQTILQALRSAGRLPAGAVTDWTDQTFRGLQVDSGRRYYSLGWLKNQIKDLAYTKMNYLQLRVKDDQGLRVESTVAPKLVDRLPAGGSWSKAQIADLVAFARRYHVTIVPEIDVPGHSSLDTQVYPEYALPEKTGYDYSRADVREHLARWVREIGATFGTPYVHLGGDEFFDADNPRLLSWVRGFAGPKATGEDGYKALFNYLAGELAEDGRGTWMWNDMISDPAGGAVRLSRDITIDYWAQIYDAPPAGAYLDAGFTLIGSSSDLYHDLWPPLTADDKNNTINQPWPAGQWTTYGSPYVYSGGWGAPYSVPAGSNSVGQFFPIWDDPHGWAPEYVLTQTLLPRLRVHAQSVWNSPDPVTDFAAFDPYLRKLGHAPGFQQPVSTLELNPPQQ